MGFYTENDLRRIARMMAEEMREDLRKNVQRSPNGNLMIEVVEVNTLPVSLRGGVAHD
ncbi:hypothetical protein [Acetobacter pasteurianus]|uniref:Uncharacterized protein n=1 Tax=Acetobacter pasteurianus NBRC 3188 TaxID=1226663 RepID=A0A401WUT6_ACEPA|nr:hypothetical protein [Acetobacter pasteurianus]GCD53020.1 hypothetical protein NBRC3188_1717 [Acetobacter pasteurianus NBRC 3188]